MAEAERYYRAMYFSSAASWNLRAHAKVKRRPPYIYDPEEIARLVRAAARLELSSTLAADWRSRMVCSTARNAHMPYLAAPPEALLYYSPDA